MLFQPPEVPLHPIDADGQAVLEGQQIHAFDGETVENALRNTAQGQREVGYVFAGSQPSLMEQMLSPKHLFHKAGPRLFLDKIPEGAWRELVGGHFPRRRCTLNEEGLDHLLRTSDLIPYDVQRLVHELWDESDLGRSLRRLRKWGELMRSTALGLTDKPATS